MLVAWVVASLVFLSLRTIPGDAVEIQLAEGGASPEVIAARRHALGLDQPLSVQYVRWIGGVLRLDFGISIVSERPISPDIVRALPRTLELSFSSLLFAALLGLPLGILAAHTRGSVGDLAVTVSAVAGISVPSFVSGTILLLLFGLLLRWFPTAGYVGLSENFLAHLKYLFLPMITLAFALSAIIVRFTRSAMLEVLSGEYIRTAHAKGVPHPRVLYHHALKNALIPVVTMIGVEGGSLLGGTIIVEYVYNWPGISTLLIQGVTTRDYPMVQAVVLVIAFLFLTLNLIVDIANGYLDPKIRYN